VFDRVNAATGISIRTFRRIKQEKNQVDNGERNEFTTPNKKRTGRNRKKTIILDDADKGILRRTYNRKTSKETNKKSQNNGYQGSQESVRNEIRKIGFRWKQMRNNRNILIEQTTRNKAFTDRIFEENVVIQGRRTPNYLQG
jgi:hypothetical protein